MARVISAKNSGPLSGLSIAFDLDGTLVDTAPDLVRVTNEVIALEGVGPTDYELAREVVGFGSKRLITDALERAGHSVSEDRLMELRTQFLLRYSATLTHHSRPYAGVREGLRQLQSLGAELSVCTNKPGWLARPLMTDLALSHHFVRIVGGDEAPRSKPDPRHLYHAVGHRRGEHMALVGDSLPDMGAALRAGAHAILMTYGYSHDPQIRLRADVRLRNFRELTPALMSVYAKRKAWL